MSFNQSKETIFRNPTYGRSPSCFVLAAFQRLPPAASPGGGGGVLGFSFAGYVPLASQSPCPIIVFFVASYRPHLSHFWENETILNPYVIEFSYPKNPKMCDPIQGTLLKM